MDLFMIIGIGWVVGMGGYIWLSKAKNYNNRNYFEISDKVIKYKKVRERTNIHKK